MNTRVRKCPYCGNEMERGFVYTFAAPGILFLKKLPKMHGFMTLKMMRKKEDGIILDGPYWTRFSETKMLAYACRKCCVVICPYRRPTQADAAPPTAQN